MLHQNTFKKLLVYCFLLFPFLITQSVSGQSVNCFTTLPSGQGGGGQGNGLSSNCANDYLEFLPQATDPVKWVRMNIHIIQKDDGSGNFQQGNTAHTAYLESVFAHVDKTFEEVMPPVWPYATNDLTFTGIRLKLMDIHYHQDSDGWEFPDNNYAYDMANFSVNPYSEINIFLHESDEDNFLGGSASGLPVFNNINSGGYAAIMYKNVYNHYLGNSGSSPERPAADLAHEVGHALGLPHVGGSGCSDGDNLPDTPEEIQAIYSPYFNAQNAPCFNHSNNVMSYNLHPSTFNPQVNHRYFSPHQIAYMNAVLSRNGSFRQYLCMPDCEYDAGSPEVIWGNVSWDLSRNMTSDLVIPQGQKLTIKDCAIINFPKEATVYIERGGELVIDGAILTSLCGEMWQGIQVWGDPNLSQNVPTPLNQARLTLKNGAIIEHAKRAATTSRRDANDNIVWAQTGGGIIQAEDSYFIGCKLSAEFFPYQNNGPVLELGNLSYFKNCEFILNGPLKDPSETKANDAFVKMEKVKGIDFEDCVFANITPDVFPNLPGPIRRRGIGILSVDSEYQIVGCRFLGVSHGVEFFGNGLNGKVQILNSFFEEIERGYFIQGGGSHFLQQNNFSFLNSINAVDPNTLFIIHGNLSETAGFVVDDDDYRFTASNPVGVPYAYGTIIRNSSKGSTYYKNLSMRSTVGFQTEQNNPHLVTECNTFYDNAIGIAVNPWSASATLPGPWGCAGVAEGLGNKFISMNCTGGFDSHIYKGYDPLNWLLYRTSTANIFPPDQACASQVQLMSYCFPSSNGANDCAEAFDPYSEPYLILSAMGGLDIQIDELLVDYDGGMTQSLLNEVGSSGSLPGEELSLLLTESYPLSDEVVEKLIVENLTLSSYQLREVLIANSPLTSASKQALEDREPALEEEDMLAIEDAQQEPSTLISEMRSTRIGLETTRGQLRTNLIALWLDDESGEGEENVRAFLESEGTVEATKSLIPMLIDADDFGYASDLLASLASDPAHANYVSIQNILMVLGQEGKSIQQLSESQLNQLVSIGDSEGEMKYYALGILKMVTGSEFNFIPEPIDIEAGGESEKRENTVDVELSAQHVAHLQPAYPNPAHDSFSLPWYLPEGTQKAEVKLYSLNGKVLCNWPLSLSGSGTLQIARNELPNGMYFIQLVTAGGTMDTQKIVLH